MRKGGLFKVLQIGLPEDFNEGSMLVDEIKNTGKKIL